MEKACRLRIGVTKMVRIAFHRQLEQRADVLLQPERGDRCTGYVCRLLATSGMADRRRFLSNGRGTSSGEDVLKKIEELRNNVYHHEQLAL